MKRFVGASKGIGMKKAPKSMCGLCGRELGDNYKKLIVRDVEVRGNSKQLFTLGEIDMCGACGERFGDFQERCRLSADE